MTSLKKILSQQDLERVWALSALIKKLSQSNSFECKLGYRLTFIENRETINEIKLDGHEISFKQELDFTDDTDY